MGEFNYELAKFLKITCQINSFIEVADYSNFTYSILLETIWQQLYHTSVSFKQNFINSTAGLFDKTDFMWFIYESAVKTLTLTVKAKPDANPQKQIPGDM